MRKRERTTMLINEAEVLEAAHASLQVSAGDDSDEYHDREYLLLC